MAAVVGLGNIYEQWRSLNNGEFYLYHLVIPYEETDETKVGANYRNIQLRKVINMEEPEGSEIEDDLGKYVKLERRNFYLKGLDILVSGGKLLLRVTIIYNFRGRKKIQNKYFFNLTDVNFNDGMFKYQHCFFIIMKTNRANKFIICNIIPTDFEVNFNDTDLRIRIKNQIRENGRKFKISKSSVRNGYSINIDKWNLETNLEEDFRDLQKYHLIGLKCNINQNFNKLRDYLKKKYEKKQKRREASKKNQRMLEAGLKLNARSIELNHQHQSYDRMQEYLELAEARHLNSLETDQTIASINAQEKILEKKSKLLKDLERIKREESTKRIQKLDEANQEAISQLDYLKGQCLAKITSANRKVKKRLSEIEGITTSLKELEITKKTILNKKAILETTINEIKLRIEKLEELKTEAEEKGADFENLKSDITKAQTELTKAETSLKSKEAEFEGINTAVKSTTTLLNNKIVSFNEKVETSTGDIGELKTYDGSREEDEVLGGNSAVGIGVNSLVGGYKKKSYSKSKKNNYKNKKRNNRKSRKYKRKNVKRNKSKIKKKLRRKTIKL